MVNGGAALPKEWTTRTRFGVAAISETEDKRRPQQAGARAVQKPCFVLMSIPTFARAFVGSQW